MKPLRLGKTRLSGHLTPSDRATLSLNMLGVVVESCVKAELSHVWVLGGDDTVECQAIELGVQWRDDNGVGLNLALAQAFEWVFPARGASFPRIFLGQYCSAAIFLSIDICNLSYRDSS